MFYVIELSDDHGFKGVMASCGYLGTPRR
uniref:Uncharacterized protein n=1 Tax=Arundo donax TaxID=35708 RepID=A0A0A8XVB4_ARUDO